MAVIQGMHVPPAKRSETTKIRVTTKICDNWLDGQRDRPTETRQTK